MRKFTFLSPAKLILGLAVVASTFSACKKNESIDGENNVKGPDLAMFALAEGNKLIALNANAPQTPTATVDITGMLSGETLIGIDFRPATGQLYGISTGGRLYTINTASGAVRPVGSSTIDPALSGLTVGFDFNPTVDRIRLVTKEGQNLRLNPETGTVAAVDGNINTNGNANVASVAYTNNTAGASTTTLFDIDVTNDKLYRQDPPNAGTLVEVGALGVAAADLGGFDISPSGDALAALEDGGKSTLYSINLETGKASKIGDLSAKIIGIAIPTNPVAYAVNNTNGFVIFNPTNPATAVTKTFSGLVSGDEIVGLDFRPATGQLYGLGSGSRIYAINTSSGAATAIGTLPIVPTLSGTDFGFDFNPTVDRIRIVSNTGQNLRVNPETGVIAAVDGNLNPGSPAITAAAYTNNFAGATTTVLYDIDAATDKLFKQDPPNSGGLVEVGALGINVEAASGFDIGGTSGKAYAILTTGTTAKIYTINLQTGAATAIGDFPTTVKAMAVGLGF